MSQDFFSIETTIHQRFSEQIHEEVCQVWSKQAHGPHTHWSFSVPSRLRGNESLDREQSDFPSLDLWRIHHLIQSLFLTNDFPMIFSV